MITPVLLITYKRPELTKKIFSILKKNNVKNLFVFNDGPKSKSNNLELNEIIKTRKIINYYHKSINFKKKILKKNIGLNSAIPLAIDWVFKYHDKVIIIEDDCIVEKDFFIFCEQLLKLYENDQRISQISGSNLLNHRGFSRRNNDSYFFSKFTPVWGWATWKNRWEKVYDKKMKNWSEVKRGKWLFDILKNKENGKYWLKIFNKEYNKIIWDRIWTFSNFINNRISIIPSKNLVSNLGYDKDASGINPKKWSAVKIENMEFPLKHPNIIAVDEQADSFISAEGFSTPKLTYRIKNFIKRNF